MDSSSIYYDAGPVNGNLRFNTEYVEFDNEELSEDQSESKDMYLNEDDINNNVENTKDDEQYASFIKSDLHSLKLTLNESTEVLKTNIDKIYKRKDTLEILSDKADSISSDAEIFNNKSRALKREMWCKNYMVHLTACMGLFVIVIIVILSTINYN